MQPIIGQSPALFRGRRHNTSSAENRDDNPTDSDSPGTIYDLDAPGVYRVDAPAGEIRRGSWNFKDFAQAEIDGRTVRVSEVEEFWVRISIEQVDAPSGTNWVLATDVQGDNHAGPGTSPITWNLQ